MLKMHIYSIVRSMVSDLKDLIDGLKKFIVVTGHYGCGKTNFSINLALEYAKRGHKVTIADLDIVNPYFRTSDYRSILEEKGIEVVAPVFAATNLDIPSLPARMYGIFESDDIVIIDVGGDDVGATVLGRFRPKFEGLDYDMLYVVNRFRSMTVEPEEAVEILSEIEGVTRLKATKIVNNSHLMDLTDENVVTEGVLFANRIAELTELPVWGTTLRKDLVDKGYTRITGENTYPIDIHVKTVW